jgi:ubiquinone/menaquinone biosynthesis C-methylase UbiE
MSSEAAIEAFWDSHPCGENLVGEARDEYEQFFTRYDRLRYSLESHIPRCLDDVGFAGQQTLEIGLGQGADSEQIIRRGAHWSGVDLTQASVDRVRTRLELRDLPYVMLAKGSVVALPFPERSFDIVYSHGVLHHVPEIERAQREIARVLRPDGRLVVMLYAKRSLNYLVSIAVLRRLGLLAMHATGIAGRGVYATHLAQARAQGIRRYLSLENFVHRNTDGPLNPYSKVYDRREVERDFSAFRVVHTHQELMHAPPLPVHGLPGARWLGWHLWVHMVPR